MHGSENICQIYVEIRPETTTFIFSSIEFIHPRRFPVLAFSVFEIFLCFIASSAVTRRKEECHFKMYGFSEYPQHTLKEYTRFMPICDV